MTMMSQFVDMTSSSMFVWRCFVSLVRFNYWSKFYANIITGSGVMPIYLYKGWSDQKSGNGKCSRLKFAQYLGDGISKGYQIWHKCLLQLLPFAKTNRLWGRRGKITSPQIRVKNFFNKCDQICRFLRIWSHLLKGFLIAYFRFVQFYFWLTLT